MTKESIAIGGIFLMRQGSGQWHNSNPSDPVVFIADDRADARLDGVFTAEQLRALADFMDGASPRALLKALIESDSIVNYDSLLCWACGEPEAEKLRAKGATEAEIAKARHAPDCLLEQARTALKGAA